MDALWDNQSCVAAAASSVGRAEGSNAAGIADLAALAGTTSTSKLGSPGFSVGEFFNMQSQPVNNPDPGNSAHIQSIPTRFPCCGEAPPLCQHPRP